MTHVELYFPRQNEDRELAELAARARDGSAAAFDELAARVRSRIVGWASGFTGDADEAEDIAQIVLLRLHDHVAEFEGRSRFTSWVYRIARNVSLARGRARQRRESILDRHQVELAEAENVHPYRAIDLVALAERSLGGLPARQREIFEAVDLRGRRVVDVAAELGLNPVTARVWLMRARRAVRLQMLAAEPTLLEDYEP